MNVLVLQFKFPLILRPKKPAVDQEYFTDTAVTDTNNGTANGTNDDDFVDYEDYDYEDEYTERGVLSVSRF